MKSFLLIFSLVTTLTAFANSTDLSFLSATFSQHTENREFVENVNRENKDFFLAYDHLLSVENNIYLGVRLGLYQEEVLTSLPIIGVHSRFILGSQGYKYFSLSDNFGIKAGMAIDLMYGTNRTPISLYVAGLSGARFFIQDNIYLEAPIEIGTWPLYDGINLFSKVGLQIGYGF